MRGLPEVWQQAPLAALGPFLPQLGSDALLLHRQEHLIKGPTHETPGQPTWGFHDPYSAELDMLRSQMLYPLSYERWEGGILSETSRPGLCSPMCQPKTEWHFR